MYDSEKMIKFFCEICSIQCLNDFDYQNHLDSFDHLTKQKELDVACTKSPTDEMEINCVFCGIMFDSIEKVQNHIAEEHDPPQQQQPMSNNISINNFPNNSIIIEPKELLIPKFVHFSPLVTAEFKPLQSETSPASSLTEKIVVYDVEMRIIPAEQVKLPEVKFCGRCNRHFIDEDNLRLHQFRDHAIRKRKRSSNPNGVEGIIVTGDGRWSCDVCGRQFPTLKQAKVHKFKSHIEPAQKQEMMTHDFVVRKENATNFENHHELSFDQFQRSLHSTISSINNVGNLQKCEEIANIVKVKDENPIESETSIKEALKYNDNTEIGNLVIDLSHSSSPAEINSSPDIEPIWKLKTTSAQEMKISITKVSSVPLNGGDNKQNSPIVVGNAIRSTSGFTNRNYQCSHCASSFVNKAAYSRHVATHQRGKSFICQYCGFGFTRNHTLKHHRDTKCIILNPIVGVNCSPTDQCSKCNLFFANSKSLLSHCKRICKTVSTTSNSEDDECGSSKESAISEETNAQVDTGDMDLDDNESAPIPIPHALDEFVNHPAFVTKRKNEFNCNLCCIYFASYKSILHHLEDYHKIQGQPKKENRKLSNGFDVNNSVLNIPILDCVQVCNECGLKFGSKDSLIRHKQHAHRNDNIPIVSQEKNVPVKEEELSPQKRLSPSNFVLPMCTSIASPEAINLSVNHHNGHLVGQTASNNSFTSSQIMHSVNLIPNQSSGTYRPPPVKKTKVPPNANGFFECLECHKTFSCRSSLSNHVKSHYNFKNKPYTCENCNEGFMSSISYEGHRKSLCAKLFGEGNAQNADGNNSSGSGQSDLKQASTSAFSLSNSSPSSSRNTFCMHCNASFPDRPLLEEHAGREHSNENGEVKCIMCKRSFSTYMAFKVHMTKSHGGPNGTPLKNHQNAAVVGNSNSPSLVSGQIIKPKQTPADAINLVSLFPATTETTINGSFSSISQYSISQIKPKPQLTGVHLNTFFPSSIENLNSSFSPLLRHNCQNCNKDFITAQALSNHKKSCLPPQQLCSTNVNVDSVVMQ